MGDDLSQRGEVSQLDEQLLDVSAIVEDQVLMPIASLKCRIPVSCMHTVFGDMLQSPGSYTSFKRRSAMLITATAWL